MPTSTMRPGRPTRFTGAWAALREALGGTDKLAEALGATTNMVQKWALHGQKPSKPTQRLIALVCEQYGVVNPLSVDTVAPASGVDASNEALDQWLTLIHHAERKTGDV